MSTTIFVRERRKVGEGERQPRYRIVAVSGNDVKIEVEHIRKQELDVIAERTGAEVVYLEPMKGEGKGQRHRGGREED